MRSSFAEKYGPCAVIAGGSEGIGAAYARALAARGLDIALIALPGPELDGITEELRRDFDVDVAALPFDLASNELEAFTRDLVAERDIGLFVYNAAISPIGPFLDTDLEVLRRMLRVNVTGPLTMAHIVGRDLLRRQRGGMIFMASLAGLQGSAMVAAYAATKAFNLVLAEGLWAELRDAGVDVLGCVAGPTSTPGYWASKPASLGLVAPPLQQPDEVAAAALEYLGQGPSVISGRINKLTSALMQRALPRRLAIELFAKNLFKMYGR